MVPNINSVSVPLIKELVKNDPIVLPAFVCRIDFVYTALSHFRPNPVIKANWSTNIKGKNLNCSKDTNLNVIFEFCKQIFLYTALQLISS